MKLTGLNALRGDPGRAERHARTGSILKASLYRIAIVDPRLSRFTGVNRENRDFQLSMKGLEGVERSWSQCVRENE